MCMQYPVASVGASTCNVGLQHISTPYFATGEVFYIMFGII